MSSIVRGLVKDGEKSIWIDSPGDHFTPTFVGANGIAVHTSDDGTLVQISLKDQPKPRQQIQEATQSATPISKKFFACRTTGENEVTVNAGIIYYYEVDDNLGTYTLLQRTYDVGEVVLSGLVNEQKIYVITYRGSQFPTTLANVTDGGSSIGTAIWQYGQFFFQTGGVVSTTTPNPSNSSVFYYHIATFFADDNGQRVEQYHDGFVVDPLIYHPRVIPS